MSVCNNLTELLKAKSKTYEQSDQFASFSAAEKLFDDLVARGVAERRGNCLMPIGNRFSIDTRVNI